MENCGLGIIHWCSLDWQSASTLIAGFAAVAAAVFIGKKQTEILKSQVAISNKQINLEEAKIRADLFDKRMETYHATVEFLLLINKNEEITCNEHYEKITSKQKTMQAFNIKMRESEFLFENKNVHKELKRIWHFGNEVDMNRINLANGCGSGEITHQELMATVCNYPTIAHDELSNLANIFRDDLSIFPKQNKIL